MATLESTPLLAVSHSPNSWHGGSANPGLYQCLTDVCSWWSKHIPPVHHEGSATRHPKQGLVFAAQELGCQAVTSS